MKPGDQIKCIKACFGFKKGDVTTVRFVPGEPEYDTHKFLDADSGMLVSPSGFNPMGKTSIWARTKKLYPLPPGGHRCLTRQKTALKLEIL